MQFDTHAHLNDERFRHDSAETIERAVKAGLSAILIAAYDEPSSESAVRIARSRKGLCCSVGIHPHDASSYDDQAEDRIRRLAMDNRDVVVAIGEIGLDYHYNLSPREVQREAFDAQIRLACTCDLPFIVHDREAHGDLLEIVKSYHDRRQLRALPGVFHCYSGSVEMARSLLDMGFYLSFAGPVTFKNARRAVEVLEAVPLDRILVETDSPYLAPEPFRGKRNEPAYVTYVVEKLAQVKGIDAKAAGDAVCRNARRLFAFDECL
jgi:TatD DNase family protein